MNVQAPTDVAPRARGVRSPDTDGSCLCARPPRIRPPAWAGVRRALRRARERHARGLLGGLIVLVLGACGRDPATAPATRVPSITVTSPTSQSQYDTFFSAVRLGGSVSGARTVRWVNAANESSGDAFISTSGDPGTWFAEISGLVQGGNPITIYADADGRGRSIGRATIRVLYDPRLDPEPPVIFITFPTVDPVFTTDSSPIVLAGVASDNSGNFGVKWINTRTGVTGIATGAGQWLASVPLAAGDNLVIVTAVDRGGNEGRDSLLVTQEPTAN